jgi:membrane protein implicated in regulation of membrane protease activity
VSDRSRPDVTRWLRGALLTLSGVCALSGMVMVGVACFFEPLESPRTAVLVAAAFPVITLGVVALFVVSLVTRRRTRSRRSDRPDGRRDGR